MATDEPQHGYLVPFERLCEITRDEEGNTPLTADNNLIKCIKLLLRGVYVDEDWYRIQYPDVAEAIIGGGFISAKHHFVENGYFEGRKPSAVIVDDGWYGKAYADVFEAAKIGELGSFQEHFEKFEEREGRFPRQDWELTARQ